MRRTLFFSAVHFAVVLGALVIGMDFSAVDGGTSAPVSRVGQLLFSVLAQPGLVLWDRFGYGLQNTVEWGLFMANSLLWGCALSWLWVRARRESGEPAAGTFDAR